MECQLNAVGISTAAEVETAGSYGALLLIQSVDFAASIPRLMALEGAIQGVKKAQLPDSRRS